ncbi:agmatine deiminase family protein [Campylobacter lari]|uniref:Agmatine deiminase n=1 Tax=Campylobacter lari (strain RM2100 / D67 / ATCC BAA-1060) TaxID=306263 RepID=B9KCD3_CAMLR|nr:agmatine deiminase family protein [Campylobacter lari]ACM64222.1 agmatine deiminase [Campylobacter lari RM2100]EAH7187012.1 agmatine deiminase family protein [Campylobacter lari]EAJ0336449.1 agmatine deiminase family protein [Campylobacter lari]EAK0437553.1 agmatine deiminase family protein [Campylobacter lari]EAK0442690.1 agmatine deiminase family protein [Campylobacter lari]
MRKSIAEWQKQELLLLSLPHENSDWKPYLEEILQSYEEFVKAVANFQKVLLIAPSEKDFQRFKHIKNVDFFKCDTNDTWIRDFGAIDVCEDDKLIGLDFTFNAWGDKFQSTLDNAVNSKLFSQKLSGKLEKIDFILEGGSIDFNGQGVMLTTSACLLNENRNSHLNKEQIEAKLKEIFGLKEIIWLENGFIKGDDTDSHVDTLARFINEKTIAYCVCKDENDEHYAPLKAMEEELKKTGFDLLELPLPKPLYFEGKRLGATYANFVFVNGGLIVPTYNDENDALVLENLQKACKDRKVVGVDARVFLRENGSLHCSCQNRYEGQR